MRSDRAIEIALAISAILIFVALILDFPTADDEPSAAGVEQLFAPGRQ